MAQGAKTGGRQRGTPNKTTAALKDAILKAADKAGDEAGLVGYLTRQATLNPGPFMGLLGKVLPMTLAGDPENPMEMIHKIVREVIDPQDTDRESLPAASEPGSV